MDAEVFYSEFFRVTYITRKRSIHDQLMELAAIQPESESLFTVAETSIIYGCQLLQRRLWQIRSNNIGEW